jgi:hypothetical protein
MCGAAIFTHPRTKLSESSVLTGFRIAARDPPAPIAQLVATPALVPKKIVWSKICGRVCFLKQPIFTSSHNRSSAIPAPGCASDAIQLCIHGHMLAGVLQEHLQAARPSYPSAPVLIFLLPGGSDLRTSKTASMGTR